MRVLHVAAGNLYGGVERILEEVARHGGARHEFAISFSGRLSDALDASGAAVHAVGPVRFSRPLSVWRARRRLSSVLGRTAYDVVVGHSPWAYALVAPVARRLRIRRVLWAHDALDGRHWTERRVARHAPALVICNSCFTARAIRGWLTGVRSDVVYAPVSGHAAEPGVRGRVRADLGLSDRTTVILLASRMERWKGHADLLHATRSLRGEWTVLIAGGAQRAHELAYEQELHRAAASMPAPDRIRFLGERTDVDRLLQATDIHCQPNSKPEPFGLTFVEALYAGVPVVTSDAGGAAEIVTRDCGVLVDPGDSTALAAALQGLIDDPARRRTLGAAGPGRAHALCDPVAQMATLERVLAS
jgi:glycosyltransferase involved in cell wall biosynthesis